MNFKRYRAMLTTLLVLMAISFVFTYLIVVRPVDFFTNQKQNNNVATTQDTGVQVRATYTTEDVFRPTRMVLTLSLIHISELFTVKKIPYIRQSWLLKRPI